MQQYAQSPALLKILQSIINGVMPAITILAMLEEDSIDISDGQWQRLAIACACLADSAHLLFG